MEQWKDIPGYERLYQVSTKGNVRSYHKAGNRILKQHISKGYCYATLIDDNRRKMVLVHRLVAQAFIENTENKPDVNHKDGNKTNNNVENLEWVTKSENSIHSHRVLGRKTRKGEHHTEEAKEKMRKNFKKCGESHNAKKVRNVETGEVFDCVKSACEKYGEKAAGISLCCKGKRKICKGYHWEYA